MHYQYCLEAGLDIFGTNAEVMPGQWEYQIGTTKGITCADHLAMSRYLLHRVAEEFKVSVTFDPKPIKGDWNGTGCHTNFSNNSTRNKETGLQAINEIVAKLEKYHAETIFCYGQDNDQRLSGKHETSSMLKFTSGVSNRAASVRISTNVNKKGYGYLEDRRPGSNMDPYIVSALLLDIAQNNGKHVNYIKECYELALKLIKLRYKH